jgi:hypothetical protein
MPSGWSSCIPLALTAVNETASIDDVAAMKVPLHVSAETVVWNKAVVATFGLAFGAIRGVGFVSPIQFASKFTGNAR